MAGRLWLRLSIAAFTMLAAGVTFSRAEAQKKPTGAVTPRLGRSPRVTATKGKPSPRKTAVRRRRRRRRRRGPGRVLRLQGDVIKGRLQKPEAFYVLQRTGVTFDGLKLKTKLVPKILQALRKPPF